MRGRKEISAQPVYRVFRTFIRLAMVTALAGGLSTCASGTSWHGSGLNYPVSVDWKDTRWCVPLRLRTVLRKVSRRFGPVTVHSSHRWPIENRKKGGKPRSYHLNCKAVDFSVRGNPAGVTQYLVSQPQVGGYSYYRQGFYHIDSGPRRTW